MNHRVCKQKSEIALMTIAHAHGRRAFGSQLSHFDLVSQKIGLSSMKLFALESMVYMTAGLHDHQKAMQFIF